MHVTAFVLYNNISHDNNSPTQNMCVSGFDNEEHRVGDMFVLCCFIMPQTSFDKRDRTVGQFIQGAAKAKLLVESSSRFVSSSRSLDYSISV